MEKGIRGFKKGHKINLGRKRPKRSKEWTRKITLSRGNYKGKNNPNYGKKHTKETKQKIREKALGRKVSETTKRKISEATKGKKNHWFGKNNPYCTGKNHWNWKGGITKLNLIIRASAKYKKWINSIFERDNFTCQYCGDNKGGNLNSHHLKRLNKIIKEYKLKTFKEAENCRELWNINNGITLCKKCHKKVHKVMDRTIRIIIDEKRNEIKKANNLYPQRASEIIVELSALIGNINDELLKRQMAFNEKKMFYLAKIKSVAKADVEAQCTEEYRQYQEAKGYRELITEMIRGLKYYLRAVEDEKSFSKHI